MLKHMLRRIHLLRAATLFVNATERDRGYGNEKWHLSDQGRNSLTKSALFTSMELLLAVQYFHASSPAYSTTC